MDRRSFLKRAAAAAVFFGALSVPGLFKSSRGSSGDKRSSFKTAEMRRQELEQDALVVYSHRRAAVAQRIERIKRAAGVALLQTLGAELFSYPDNAAVARINAGIAARLAGIHSAHPDYIADIQGLSFGTAELDLALSVRIDWDNRLCLDPSILKAALSSADRHAIECARTDPSGASNRTPELPLFEDGMISVPIQVPEADG